MHVDKVNKGTETVNSIILPINEEFLMWNDVTVKGGGGGGLLACLSSVPKVVTTVHGGRIRAHGSGL